MKVPLGGDRKEVAVTVPTPGADSLREETIQPDSMKIPDILALSEFMKMCPEGNCVLNRHRSFLEELQDEAKGIGYPGRGMGKRESSEGDGYWSLIETSLLH